MQFDEICLEKNFDAILSSLKKTCMCFLSLFFLHLCSIFLEMSMYKVQIYSIANQKDDFFE